MWVLSLLLFLNFSVFQQSVPNTSLWYLHMWSVGGKYKLMCTMCVGVLCTMWVLCIVCGCNVYYFTTCGNNKHGDGHQMA